MINRIQNKKKCVNVCTVHIDYVYIYINARTCMLRNISYVYVLNVYIYNINYMNINIYMKMYVNIF